MEFEKAVSPLIKIIDELGGKDVPLYVLFPELHRKGIDLTWAYKELRRMQAFGVLTFSHKTSPRYAPSEPQTVSLL